MKNLFLYLISLSIVCSCLIRKTNEISYEEIRPIVIPVGYDTSFIKGSQKISVINEYWNWGSFEKTWVLTERIEDSALNIFSERMYYSDTSILSVETIERSNYDQSYINLLYSKDTNGDFEYLLDCDKKEVLKLRELKDEMKHTKLKARIYEFVETNYGIQNKETIELDFNDIVHQVRFDRLFSDSLFSMDFNLILKDKKRIPLYRVFCNQYIDDVYVVGAIIANIKPINLNYSEIESLINKVDSVESVDQFMEIVIDSVNNDLLLEVTAKKDYELVEKRKSKHTQVVFHVNVHTKEVLKISERRYESIIAH